MRKGEEAKKMKETASVLSRFSWFPRLAWEPKSGRFASLECEKTLFLATLDAKRRTVRSHAKHGNEENTYAA